MSANTKIEWADHTFNPWEGCTKVSPGCAHCYAEARNARFGGGTAPNWGKGAPRRRTSVQNWNEPRRWNRLQETSGAVHHGAARPRVFCASLADWLDNEVPIEWLAELLALIRETPNLDWLLLTKRPENWQSRIKAARNHATCHDAELALWLNDWLPPQPWAPGCAKTASGLIDKKVIAPANVWIGTTVENQALADQRIPALLLIPARVRFLSCEPLLGQTDLGLFGTLPANVKPGYTMTYDAIDWVICGGESGKDARPMHPAWARSLRDQCAAAGVPFFFKQWGEWLPFDQCGAAGVKMPILDALNHASTGAPVRVGKQAAGRLIDGVEHSEFPA